MTSLELTGVTSGGVPWDPGGLDPFPVDAGWWTTPSDWTPMEFSAITAPWAPDWSDPFASEGGGAFLQDEAGNIYNPDGTLALSAADAFSAGFLPEPSPPGPWVPTADILREGPGGPGSWPMGPTTALGPTTIDFQLPPGAPPTDPGFLQRAGTAMGLDTRLGRLLWSLGLGAGGIGLAQLIAGGSSDGITTPQPPQTEGQRALSDLFANNPAAARALQDVILRSLQGGVTGADVLSQQLNQVLAANTVEEPIRSLIRNASLQELLAIQRGLPPTDPVTAALREQLLGVTLTGATDPRLERTFQEERDILQNKMFKARGPQWEMTTAGIDAAVKLSESQAIRNYEDYLNTVRALSGPYQTGVTQAVDQSTGLSQLGLPNVPATISALMGITSPAAVGGIDTTNRAALLSQASQDQAALLSALRAEAARAGLGQSISNLAGRATQQAFSLAA